MLLIGSRALNYWYPEHRISSDTDWDIITDEDLPWAEVHPTSTLNNAKYLNLPVTDYVPRLGLNIPVASLETLAEIKRSHLHRTLGFGKHITHYHRHLRKHLVGDDWKIRQALTIKDYPEPGPNLKQSVEKFFDDAVTKKYDHDYLHTLFAVDGVPMYSKMQRDGSTVWCEKDLWDTFTHDEKLRTVMEETSVIATERFLVPSNWECFLPRAYNKSLEKVCTTLCSGWFRDFAIEHFIEVLAMKDENLFLTMKNKLSK